jgi:Response regulator containing a CheY-like receiver domain and an HTH DNA-binding domain
MHLQSVTVAIADDHVPSRKVMRNFLLKGNYRVIMEADNGQKLLTQLESAATLPDICLLDINMPELNGWETARLLKAKWPSIRILAISGDDLYSLTRINHPGADGFINKNCTQVELNEAMSRILES